MVQLEHFATLFILLLSQKVKSQLAIDDGKKNAKSKLQSDDHFESDLVLLPQQSQMMYYDVFDEGSFDSYKWSKNSEGHVIVPYRISKASHYRKCIETTFCH